MSQRKVDLVHVCHVELESLTKEYRLFNKYIQARGGYKQTWQLKGAI